MTSRIGIKDIALRAGVSKGTVDRVLHNRGNVSPGARAKVVAAMKELDYQPNVIASALASKKPKKIAIMIPDSKKDPFWKQPQAGILKAEKVLRDYRVIIDFYYFRDADGAHFLINQNPQKQGFLGIMNIFNHLVLKKEIKHLQFLPLDVVIKENVQYYLEEKTEELHLVF